ncbi:MAG: amidohydrolase, partial [Mycobacterium gordonae]|nr:amidohydrolase [Mycobacterium gordonae]
MDETEAVRQLWQELDLPGIVDVHTHFMPKSVMDKVWKYFDEAGPLVGRVWPVTYRTDEQRRLEKLR